MSCASADTSSEVVRLHDQVVTRSSHLEKQLDSLATSGSLPDSVLAWQNALDAWKLNLIEIPGHNHHEHEHTHGPSLPLTPSEILALHVELEKQLTGLEMRVQSTIFKKP
jgi:hypothetical protein